MKQPPPRPRSRIPTTGDPPAVTIDLDELEDIGSDLDDVSSGDVDEGPVADVAVEEAHDLHRAVRSYLANFEAEPLPSAEGRARPSDET